MRLVLAGQGHRGRRKYKLHLAGRPVEDPRMLRDDYIVGLQNMRIDLQRPLSNVDGGVGGFGVI